MKKIYLYVFLFFPLLVFSQHIKRCGTTEKWNEMKQQNPQLAVDVQRAKRSAAQWASAHPNARTSSVSTLITIPVVVHVLYHNSGENISDAQIQSQIDVLNEDFIKMNADRTNVPVPWQSRAANVGLQFGLAVQDPNGNATTGIERRSVSVSSWSNPDDMKAYSSGGLDAWNRDNYLNIWVGNLGGSILGVTQFPGLPAATDGMCILYNAFGRSGNVAAPYDKGRTTTHEMGHWLGLNHIWGDDDNDNGICEAGAPYFECAGDDNMADTPNQGEATYGKPSFPKFDCCSSTPTGDPVNGIMWMNYMDYTDDDHMWMFTNDQSTYMNGVINTTRLTILTSPGLVPIGIREISLKNLVDIYPNPASDVLHVDTHFNKATPLNIRISDLLGNSVINRTESQVTEEKITLPVSDLSEGIYMVTLQSPSSSVTERITVRH